MADHWLAVFAGFLLGLLVGWLSFAVLAALVVSGRISEEERQAADVLAAQQRAENN